MNIEHNFRRNMVALLSTVSRKQNAFDKHDKLKSGDPQQQILPQANISDKYNCIVSFYNGFQTINRCRLWPTKRFNPIDFTCYKRSCIRRKPGTYFSEQLGSAG